jgi:ABC-type phosphate transport system substrate-binding protein
MKTRRTSKKLITLLLMLTMLLSLVACSTKHEAVVPDKDPTKTVEDKSYTEDIEKEKGVQAGKVYIQDGTAIGTMIIKDSFSDADAKKLAEKYAAQLKETYKDMKINVQAVKGGKNIANITLEK